MFAYYISYFQNTDFEVHGWYEINIQAKLEGQ